MIVIDVLVPPLDRAYDFEVDENEGEVYLTKKIGSLIEEHDKVRFSPGKRELFFLRGECFLDSAKSLKEQGVSNGDRLILV